MASRFSSIGEKFLVFAASLALTASVSSAQYKTAALSAEDNAKVAGIANRVLSSTGVPSASIAIVKDGQLAYTGAFGMARLQPPTPATPEMRYSVGSVSKQITASDHPVAPAERASCRSTIRYRASCPA